LTATPLPKGVLIPYPLPSPESKSGPN
jgi:hypothetical protein